MFSQTANKYEKIDLSKLKILLVDDQQDSRALIRNMLSEFGVTQIFEANDGADGLSFMEGASDLVNFVICDWNMPFLEGIDVLKGIRKERSNVPFLMVTGRGDGESVKSAKEAGVTGYIKKPFSSHELEAKLRIIMYRKMKEAEAAAFS